MAKLQRFTESLCMTAPFYKDITETASSSLKESAAKANVSYTRQFNESESFNESKVRQILKEANVEDTMVNKIVQKLHDVGVKTNEHRIYRIPISRINDASHLNGNHRAYTKALWENVMNNQEGAWKGLCGLADHPGDDEQGKFRDSAVVWLGMEIDDLQKLIYGICSFVGPYGHLAQEIIDVGGRIGSSTSGFGELEPDGVTVDPETYQIERLADIVLNPSQDVYGDINDEQRNIEYSKQQVEESYSNKSYSNNLKESNTMDNQNGVKAALSKVEEKELRKHIKSYLEENTKISNPVKQLADLEEIQGLIQEGQLADLESGVEQKLNDVHKKIEEAVELSMKMKESEVTVTTPDGVAVKVSGDGTPVDVAGAGDVSLSTAPVASAPVDGETPLADDTQADGDDDFLMESKNGKGLSKSQAKTLRKYVENFMKESHEGENPLKTYSDLTEILATIREGKLGNDLEEGVVNKLEETRKQLEKDIADAQKMKTQLGAKDLSQITESTKQMMETGEILAGQITDYKSLCEALTKRNTSIIKSYNALKIKFDLSESKEEDSVLNRNKKIVESEKKYDDLKKQFDELDESAGKKVVELQTALDTYKSGNAKLEKTNGILETKLREAQKEVADVKAKFDEQIDMIDNQYESEVKSISESKNANTSKLNSLEKEIATLKSQIATLSEANKKLIDDKAAQAVKIVESVKEPVAAPKATESLAEAVSFRESGVENFWQDLSAKYGDSVKMYENKIRNSKTVREAQQNWLAVMSDVDENLKTVRETTFAGKGIIGSSERLAVLKEHGMTTPDDVNRNNVSAINERFLEKMHAMGLQ